MKILIVDDNAAMRRTIRNIVALPDDETRECSDGTSLVPEYDSFRPDWVRMDLRMEPVNGIAATRILKAAFPQAHVAIVTNYGQEEYRDEAGSAGAERFFLKDNLTAIRYQLYTSGLNG